MCLLFGLFLPQNLLYLYMYVLFYICVGTEFVDLTSMALNCEKRFGNVDLLMTKFNKK